MITVRARDLFLRQQRSHEKHEAIQKRDTVANIFFTNAITVQILTEEILRFSSDVDERCKLHTVRFTQRTNIIPNVSAI